MIHVLGCIFGQHDMRLVALAAGLCILACATALTIIARACAAGPGRTRLLWLSGAGTVAGCGIWATHFVAMLAYQSGLPLNFNAGLTILSAIIAMSLCGAGFALTIRRGGAIPGGAITGLAITAMHYTGMAAVALPARAVWNYNYVAASLLIGVSLSALAMHVAMGRSRHRTGLAVTLFSLAILGMHFTGMSAVLFIPDSSRLVGPHIVGSFALAIVVAASAAFIVAQGLIVALVDRYFAQRARGEAARMRTHIAEMEGTQQKLKKTSDDLLVALNAAAEANQAKASFLASMSHELRTPLNAIIGFSDTMMLEIFGPLSDRYKSYAGDIRHSGEHLLALINDVLDLSRLDAGQGELHEERFDAATAIDESLRMIVGQAQKAQISLTTDIAHGLPPLTADKRRIKQILINLVSNALKFTPAGGQVRIVCRLVPAGLEIAVSDNGIGIAPEDIPKVLERFGQVDSPQQRKHTGTGLGLPLSRQLAQLHGGELTLESTVDVGTTVTVTLPASRLVPAAAVAAA
ncbi:MAG: Histidine kinase [Alphaproteobacteria bacterium]|nr:Histidine kinase [Alphaproteobacteria bacterium]